MQMLCCSRCCKGHLVKKCKYHNVQRLAMQQLDKAFVTWMKRSPFLIRGPWVASVDPRLFQTKLPSKRTTVRTSSKKKPQYITFRREGAANTYPTQFNFPIKQHKVYNRSQMEWHNALLCPKKPFFHALEQPCSTVAHSITDDENIIV